MGKPTDSLIDVGGYRLSIRIVGEGGPAVVCVPALGGAHDSWLDVVSELAETTTVVTYARPGLGRSDQLPPEEAAIPRDGRWIATQLRTLLRNAGVPPPYILTSGSIGAFVVDQFTVAWPDEVAGLVLNDPTGARPYVGVANPDRPYATENGDLQDADEGGGITFSGALLKTFLTVAAPANTDGRFVVLSSAVGRWLRSTPGEWHRPLSLADIDMQWREMQSEWAARLHAVHLIAATAGHHIYREEPQLTAAVVRAVVDGARAGQPVAIDQTRIAAVGAKLAP